MTEITLKRLSLVNFKGIEELSVDFSKVTNIYGENGTGKTTIVDAFMWLLFDKDSNDSSVFEVRTLDSNKKVIPNLDHEVSCELAIDGKITTLKKRHIEKWVKKKGAVEKVFEGTTNEYYYNDVPLKKTEYIEKLNSIIDIESFKLLSKPRYFNETLHWQKRREILFQMLGKVTDEEIISKSPELSKLSEILAVKTLSEYKKELSAKKSKLSKAKSEIEPRIKEDMRSMPEAQDWGAIEAQISIKEAEIRNIEYILTDSMKLHEEKNRHKKKIFDLQTKLLNIENQHKLAIQEKENKLLQERSGIGHEIELIQQYIKSKKSFIAGKIEINKKLESEKAEFLKTYKARKKEEFIFDENLAICPICRRGFDAADIESKKQELSNNFYIQRDKDVEMMRQKGKGMKDEILKNEEFIRVSTEALENYEAELAKNNDRKCEIEKHLSDIEKAKHEEQSYLHDEEYLLLTKEIKRLQDELPSQENDLTTYKEQKKQLIAELDELKKVVYSKTRIEELEKRIAELENDERKLAQAISDLEAQEFMIERFTALKTESMIEKINSNFKYLKFVMYEEQMNGGLAECCEAVINGVPHSQVNSAAKINAGIDVINALCNAYGIRFPVFIDNRESVTELIPCEAQIINLIVSPNDKKLRVEAE